MAARVTASEARNRFGRILDRVSKGEEIVVTRHDKPVARMVPADRTARDEVRAAVAGLRVLRREIAERRGPHPEFGTAEIRSMIEVGRR